MPVVCNRLWKMKAAALACCCLKLPVLVPERLVVTGADEPVYAHAGEDVTLSCSLDTHVNVTELQVKWIKTDDDGDILVLLFADGENRPESQDGRYSGRAEFFTEEIPKGNFSMKLRKVRTEDKAEFRCEVHSDTDSTSTTARIAALGESLEGLVLTFLVGGGWIIYVYIRIRMESEPICASLMVTQLIREAGRTKAICLSCGATWKMHMAQFHTSRCSCL
uniref:Ig-like domain-containing protein n=1 Tax=Paramormyrops kingsleyae TaxID=1676925 RepID=A0A3B3TD78_9TELE